MTFNLCHAAHVFVFETDGTPERYVVRGEWSGTIPECVYGKLYTYSGNNSHLRIISAPTQDVYFIYHSSQFSCTNIYDASGV